MNDDALESALTLTGPANAAIGASSSRIGQVHRELKRKYVALVILWDEYIAANSGDYNYSRFCELYRAFEKALAVTMRQTTVSFKFQLAKRRSLFVSFLR